MPQLSSRVNSIRLVLAIFALSLAAFAAVACGSEPTPTAVPPTTAPTATSATANTPAPTDTSAPTNTPKPTATATPEPTSTDTPLPTDTPSPTLAPTTPKLGLGPGTFAVGQEIEPGLYAGMAGEGLFDSCYWARLKDVSGAFDEIIANDNAIGQFYIEVLEGDGYLETSCEIIPIAEWPGPPTHIANPMPGTYIVGRDIAAGTYQGKAGEGVLDSCYWARLSRLTGDFESLIANDNAQGQFYVKVLQSDYALTTSCTLERVD